MNKAAAAVWFTSAFEKDGVLRVLRRRWARTSRLTRSTMDVEISSHGGLPKMIFRSGSMGTFRIFPLLDLADLIDGELQII
jgi:hypothetical protein